MEYEQMPRKKRKRIKRIHIKRLALTFLVIYGICTIVGVILQQEAMLAKQADDAVLLAQQIENVRVANAELENKLEFTETEEYIERIARDQLGYVKEGEIKIIEQK